MTEMQIHILKGPGTATAPAQLDGAEQCREASSSAHLPPLPSTLPGRLSLLVLDTPGSLPSLHNPSQGKKRVSVPGS